jgi:hypothetical protein
VAGIWDGNQPRAGDACGEPPRVEGRSPSGVAMVRSWKGLVSSGNAAAKFVGQMKTSKWSM